MSGGKARMRRQAERVAVVLVEQVIKSAEEALGESVPLAEKDEMLAVVLGKLSEHLRDESRELGR